MFMFPRYYIISEELVILRKIKGFILKYDHSVVVGDQITNCPQTTNKCSAIFFLMWFVNKPNCQNADVL